METKPTRLFSKPVIDPLNTVVWFAMDALWVARLEWPAYIAASLTLITGVMLLFLPRREGGGELLADLGINCWIVMNTVWLVYDMNGEDTPRIFAVIVGVIGLVFFIAAARYSGDIRRVRILRR